MIWARMKKRNIWWKMFHCGKYGHRTSECTKGVKKTEKLEKAEKALDEVEDNIVLCPITKYTVMAQQKERTNFETDVKFKQIPSTDLLPPS